MKSKKIKIVIVVLLVLLVLPILFFNVYTHTFSNFLADKNMLTTFYPEGIAYKHKIVMFNSNEDHRIWKFSLKNKETEIINGELSNGIWQPISDEELKYLDEVYFSGFLFEYKEHDEIYCCLYDLEKERYKDIDTGNTFLFGQEKLLFVYNKTTEKYYCVSMSI